MELYIVLFAVALLVAATLTHIINKKSTLIGHTKVAMSDEVFHETMLETADFFLNKDFKGICFALEHTSASRETKQIICEAIMDELEGCLYVNGWLTKKYGMEYVDSDVVRAIRVLWLRESIRLGGIAYLHDIMRVHFPHISRKTK